MLCFGCLVWSFCLQPCFPLSLSGLLKYFKCSVDSGRRYGNQPRKSWQGAEHDGLLGSGSFPRPSGYSAGISAPKVRSNDQYQLNRSNEPYHPPRPYKVYSVPYSCLMFWYLDPLCLFSLFFSLLSFPFSPSVFSLCEMFSEIGNVA